MQLCGKLRATTLGDLLGALHRARVSGILELEETPGGATRHLHRIHLSSGLVFDIETALTSKPIGEVLVEQGELPHEKYAMFLRKLRSDTGSAAGRILVDSGLAKRDAVHGALRSQMLERLRALFRLRDANVRFRVPRHRGSRVAVLPLKPSEFLFGTERKRDQRVAADRAASEREAPILSAAQARALRILGLAHTATPKALRAAFRRQAVRLHPDRNLNSSSGQQATALSRFVELSQAYHTALEVIGD